MYIGICASRDPKLSGLTTSKKACRYFTIVYGLNGEVKAACACPERRWMFLPDRSVDFKVGQIKKGEKLHCEKIHWRVKDRLQEVHSVCLRVFFCSHKYIFSWL